MEFPDDPIWIMADARQLSQVMTNILQNALDAIEGRKQESDDAETFNGEIILRLSAIDDEATIEVLDNGKGLPPDTLDRLTEPYVTTRAKGTGLGLAIVKTILEDHGARLRLEDREDCGARAVVSVPLFERKEFENISDAGVD
jgi:two-component system nitrogen regulation sensor histidine kinase NtrY